MKITALTILTIFTASSSAFGLNGGAKTLARSTRAVGGFQKPALVQPVDIQGNRITVSSICYLLSIVLRWMQQECKTNQRNNQTSNTIPSLQYPSLCGQHMHTHGEATRLGRHCSLFPNTGNQDSVSLRFEGFSFLDFDGHYYFFTVPTLSLKKLKKSKPKTTTTAQHCFIGFWLFCEGSSIDRSIYLSIDFVCLTHFFGPFVIPFWC